MRFSLSLISVVSPMTRAVQKVDAAPEPNENKLNRLLSSSVGSTFESRDARHPYKEAVYMLPRRLEQAIAGSVFLANEAFEAATKVFSTALSVRD